MYRVNVMFYVIYNVTPIKDYSYIKDLQKYSVLNKTIKRFHSENYNYNVFNG